MFTTYLHTYLGKKWLLKRVVKSFLGKSNFVLFKTKCSKKCEKSKFEREENNFFDLIKKTFFGGRPSRQIIFCRFEEFLILFALGQQYWNGIIAVVAALAPTICLIKTLKLFWIINAFICSQATGVRGETWEFVLIKKCSLENLNLDVTNKVRFFICLHLHALLSQKRSCKQLEGKWQIPSDELKCCDL